MGLDQYAFARKGEPLDDFDGNSSSEEEIEICYWRKHPNLQGWMENFLTDRDWETL